mgnify:CR=1 FL=1
MDTKDVIQELRIKKGLSQEELAEKSMLQGKQCFVGKTEKPFLIQKF